MGNSTVEIKCQAKEGAAFANASESGSSFTMPSELNEGIDFETLENYEVGGKLAKQLGADLSDDHYEKDREKKVDESEEAMREAAKPQDWKGRLAEMDQDARVAATLECLGRKNNQKEILYDLLVFCEQERSEDEVVPFLESHKEFKNGYHSASKYLFFMQRTGGIEEIEYDSDGARITDEMRDELRELGAPEEEIQDLAVEWHYVTTEAGKQAISKFDPVDRTKEMLATQAESRMASYKRLLDFCKEPKSLDEIVKFMDGDPGLEIDSRTGAMMMQPSAYIGKLDQAGALTWEDGWKTTEGGLEVLETLLAEYGE